MIQEFVASWPLFHNTYLVGWLIALLLALVGVLVVARDQIFIGAAVSQASTWGSPWPSALEWAATEALEWFTPMPFSQQWLWCSPFSRRY